MAKRWKKLTDEFNAEAENGKIYHLRIYTTFMDARSLSDPAAMPVEGLKEVRTIEGYHCNHIDSETWEIVELGIKVKKI